MHSMQIRKLFWRLLLKIAKSPLGEQDGLHLGFEHALKDEILNTRGQTILDVICEGSEHFFIHNVMGISSDTHHEMMRVLEVGQKVYLILEC